MRRLVSCCVLLLLFSFLVPKEASAQRRSGPEEFSLANRIWYGTGGILGWSSFNDGFTRGSLFQIGLTPMVGYKVTDFLSVGPRISVVYSAYRIDVGNGVQKVRPVDFGYGAFARSRIYSGLFAQVEYEKLSFGFPTPGANSQGQLEYDVARVNRDNAFLGFGWNPSQGAIGSEIMLLYNFLIPSNSLESPISLRAGLTWRF